jgi:hypothetical protein
MSSYVNQGRLGNKLYRWFATLSLFSLKSRLSVVRARRAVADGCVGTFEVREKFLVLIDGLVAFPRALVDLAVTVVGEGLNRRVALLYQSKIRANSGGTNLGSTNQRLIDACGRRFCGGGESREVRTS